MFGILVIDDSKYEEVYDDREELFLYFRVCYRRSS